MAVERGALKGNILEIWKRRDRQRKGGNMKEFVDWWENSWETGSGEEAPT